MNRLTRAIKCAGSSGSLNLLGIVKSTFHFSSPIEGKTNVEDSKFLPPKVGEWLKKLC